MSGWLPPGCTDADIDRASPGYDDNDDGSDDEQQRYEYEQKQETLRAAAPELLAALKHIRDSFWSENEPYQERFEHLQETARAAIAKAEGKP
jgi:hypothetical protein